MNTILVTGGAGFVGSHACKALARAGYLPVTFDNFERGHQWAVKWGPLERGDLRDENDLLRAFETWRPWAVTHFAAHAYVGESILEPPKYYDTNLVAPSNCSRLAPLSDAGTSYFPALVRPRAFRRACR